jgi:hypothetical protein
MGEEIPTLAKALKAFSEKKEDLSTSEIGKRLGIPEDYNKSDKELLIAPQ